MTMNNNDLSSPSSPQWFAQPSFEEVEGETPDFDLEEHLAPPLEAFDISPDSDTEWNLTYVYKPGKSGHVEHRLVQTLDELVEYLNQQNPDLTDMDSAMEAIIEGPRIQNAPISLLGELAGIGYTIPKVDG